MPTGRIVSSMSTCDVVVRPPATDGELAASCQLAAEQFIRETPQSIAARDFQHFITETPGADRSGMRCAFRGEAYLGGYRVEERWLRVGPARLRTGCIGVVVVDPAHRGQGIGKTLMGDAFARALARRQTLLLLHGLVDFYRPFGFADVFDPTDHAVRGADILSAPRVRIACVPPCLGTRGSSSTCMIATTDLTQGASCGPSNKSIPRALLGCPRLGSLPPA